MFKFNPVVKIAIKIVRKVPVTAIKASLSPIEYHTIPSHTFDLPISLENFMDNPPTKVTVVVEDGENIRFTEHEKIGVQLSKYDCNKRAMFPSCD